MTPVLSTTCILCPNGCEVTLHRDEKGYSVTGNRCKKGIAFAVDEHEAPKRMVTSTVKTVYKNQPRLSVKTASPIPKGQVMTVMDAINKVTVDRSLDKGAVVIEDVCGLGVDVVATGRIWAGM